MGGGGVGCCRNVLWRGDYGRCVLRLRDGVWFWVVGVGDQVAELIEGFDAVEVGGIEGCAEALFERGHELDAAETVEVQVFGQAQVLILGFAFGGEAFAGDAGDEGEEPVGTGDG